MMHKPIVQKWFSISFALLMGVLLVATAVQWLNLTPTPAHAEPIDPPTGYPKLSLSTLTVTPTLAGTNGVTLTYRVEMVNTGAYTAYSSTLMAPLPYPSTYITSSASASSGITPTVVSDTLVWTGTVGFDASVFLTYSVQVSPGYAGLVLNTAVISQALLLEPITLTAETRLTDTPLLNLSKTAVPEVAGPNGWLTYTLWVENVGQTAVNLPITVTDEVPLSTTLAAVGPDGISDTLGTVVTWTRAITLAYGEVTTFTFTVLVDDVTSGTVILNDQYALSSTLGMTSGLPYSNTIIDPILSLNKTTWPDPPGSNREMTYTLHVLNQGSLATNLVITDEVPANVAYVRGGTENSGIVSWDLPLLGTNETADFTYTVFISDIANVAIINEHYTVCADEGDCAHGAVLSSTIGGANFAVTAVLNPIAKKPGGGGGPVTPTLTLENLGPGNALGAQAILEFGRISVSANDLYAIPAVGTTPPFPNGPLCGNNCVAYEWVGSLNVGDVVTFTTFTGQSTIGGSEGTPYTTTIIISDSLSNGSTQPISATAVGHVTHFSNLIPNKTAPSALGAGQLLTYTINVWNSALTTDLPPTLTDTVPVSTSLVAISDGGVSLTVGSQTVVSWTLPNMGSGDRLARWFTVQVDPGLVSGTQIINDDYWTRWFETNVGAVYSHTGTAVTTTVYEVGLIDSFKVVSPVLSLPSDDLVLTYEVHLVNSSALTLTDVSMSDVLPWQDTTYQRDAVVSAGTLMSDIVSLHWTGDLAPFSEEVVTFTVQVDPGFEGVITNTAVISQADLAMPVSVTAVAYVTTAPVLHITKTASPNAVDTGDEILYTIHVQNSGQLATNLLITDSLPVDTTYVTGSASGGGVLVGDELQWQLLSLDSGESASFTFRALVGSGSNAIINANYGVVSDEGAVDHGAPVTTPRNGSTVFLPFAARQ